MWTCPDEACCATNKTKAKVCEVCGTARPAVRLAIETSRGLFCPIDGWSLGEDGFCVSGKGWPMTRSKPSFVCPICRHGLEWSGACFACHGTATGSRDDWNYPGDRYELEAGHWRLVGPGPQRVCSLAENKAALRIVFETWRRITTPTEGMARIQTLLPAARA